MMSRRICQRFLALALVAATTSHAAAPAIPAGAPPEAVAAPPITPDTGSYAVGLLLGDQLARNGLTPVLSVDALVRGLKDAVVGRAITPADRDAATKFTRDARDALAEKNEIQGREFLAANAKRAGVVTLPSGLQYSVLSAGDPNGKPPAPTDLVTVRYTAALTDGTVFDRSDAHPQPATFRVNSVFKGWQEAFESMKPGAKLQLFVPPELGYGKNSPPAIPPGAVLVYELELLRIESAPDKVPGPVAHHAATGASTTAAH